MVQPAANSISASASRNGNPSRAARRRPIEVFPAPIKPTSTMLRPVRVSGSGIVSRRAVLRVMVAKASTTPARQATPLPHTAGALDRAMIRIFLVVVAAGLLLLAVGVLILGAFPPNP